MFRIDLKIPHFRRLALLSVSQWNRLRNWHKNLSEICIQRNKLQKKIFQINSSKSKQATFNFLHWLGLWCWPTAQGLVLWGLPENLFTNFRKMESSSGCWLSVIVRTQRRDSKNYALTTWPNKHKVKLTEKRVFHNLAILSLHDPTNRVDSQFSLANGVLFTFNNVFTIVLR